MRRFDDIYAIRYREVVHPGFFVFQFKNNAKVTQTRIGPSGTVRADVEGKLIVRRELAETPEYLKSNDLRDMSVKPHAHIFPSFPPIKVKFEGFRNEIFKSTFQYFELYFYS